MSHWLWQDKHMRRWVLSRQSSLKNVTMVSMAASSGAQNVASKIICRPNQSSMLSILTGGNDMKPHILCTTMNQSISETFHFIYTLPLHVERQCLVGADQRSSPWWSLLRAIHQLLPMSCTSQTYVWHVKCSIFLTPLFLNKEKIHPVWWIWVPLVECMLEDHVFCKNKELPILQLPIISHLFNATDKSWPCYNWRYPDNVCPTSCIIP